MDQAIQERVKEMELYHIIYMIGAAAIVAAVLWVSIKVGPSVLKGAAILAAFVAIGWGILYGIHTGWFVEMVKVAGVNL